MSSRFLEKLNQPRMRIAGKASELQERKREEVRVEPPKYCGRDYAKKYVQEERAYFERELARNKLPESDVGNGGMSDVDTVTNCQSEVTAEDIQKKIAFFDDISFSKKSPSSLPIANKKEEILNWIDAYKVIIVTGATGCGKTTQVPQYILDQARERRQFCNIIVTQPRRLAAISVAKRVCEEREWAMGSVVGYQIGQKKEANDNTMITFCTTGVLLQKIVAQKSLHGYSHIILDEVHERDAEMDFLLILIRKYVNSNSRNVKIILMSATINTDTFSEYCYVIAHDNKQVVAPVVAATEKLNYDVKTFYLNDLLDIPEAKNMSPDGPDITKKGYMTAVQVIRAFDILDKSIAEKKKRKIEIGAVLVFLPGLYEIEELKRYLDSTQPSVYRWWVVPLHSSITTEEQDKVFHNPPQNHRKVVLSTNIAESSITVPDIKYVIDFCLTKVVVTDPKTNLASLQLCWTSKNSSTQRAGRAGRVSDGRVYRLVYRDFYADLDEECVPEMLRCPLDRLVLQAKLLDSGPPKAIFALALSQPDLRNIEQTILTLKEIGALTMSLSQSKSTSKSAKNKEPNSVDDLDGDLSFLGQIVSKLPMDVRLGKLIFFGNMFNVLEECIIMACAMSVKNMFSTPFQEYLKAYNSKLAWANSTCSDCIAYLNAYKVWRKKKIEHSFRNEKAEAVWCRDRFLQMRILREISVLYADVKNRLHASPLPVFENSKSQMNSVQKNLFIKLSLAAAFYPNYFLRGIRSGQADEKNAVATLSGHDPYTTVYLQGMPHNQPGILYKKSIEKQFEEVSSRVNVYFDHGSKVLINFGHYSNEVTDDKSMQIPGKIDLAVYRAVKMRQLKPDIRIPVYTPAEADRRFQEYVKRYEEIRPGAEYPIKLLEWPWDKDLDMHVLPIVGIRISSIESPTRFWARSPSELATRQYEEICEFLNRPDSTVAIPTDQHIKIRGIYAHFVGDEGRGEYVRCRVESYKHYNDTYSITFIDIGDGKTHVSRDEIRAINSKYLKEKKLDKVPDLATEFSLVKIQPTRTNEGKWNEKARHYLKEFRRNHDRSKVLLAKIYSMVNDVARVKLYFCNENESNSLKVTQPINFQLVDKGLAERCEEVFLSKQDHEERKNLQKLLDDGEMFTNMTKNLTQKEDLIQKLNAMDLEEPGFECKNQVILKGPFSPLEMKVYCATQSSMPKLAIIDRNSVNSVLLDTNPSDEHERMVISGLITISPNGDKLSLKDTTVMPSLPGLPALICLLFSPMVEMRCDPEFTRFTGALCGLGYNKSDKVSFNADKDIEIVFDVEITIDMLVKINRVRYWLSRVFAHQVEVNKREFEEAYTKLNEYINELIWHKWEPQELYFSNNSHKWGLIPEDKLLNPCNDSENSIDDPAEDYSSVYRLIWGIELDGDMGVRTEMIRKNIRTLNDFAVGKLRVKDVECTLCQIVLPNRLNARMHLKSTLHRARAYRYVERDDARSCDSQSEVTDGCRDDY